LGDGNQLARAVHIDIVFHGQAALEVIYDTRETNWAPRQKTIYSLRELLAANDAIIGILEADAPASNMIDAWRQIDAC